MIRVFLTVSDYNGISLKYHTIVIETELTELELQEELSLAKKEMGLKNKESKGQIRIKMLNILKEKLKGK